MVIDVFKRNFKCLNFKRKSSKLIGFCESNYISDLDDRRRTSVYIFTLNVSLSSFSFKSITI